LPSWVVQDGSAPITRPLRPDNGRLFGMQEMIWIWGFALAGGLAATAAVIGRHLGILSPLQSARIHLLDYLLMAVSIAWFVVKGFSP